ncbi:hypothetical protein Anapl_13949 [Anas platyrhynchos]|uniref:Uncharacterized protein n=1 Tax=Anas platyrhynchos TaxID=8839 RepID=R0LT44_ANAPL|nr:hypothetical protein Anapl_13949 [Anas platyrhynchos]
MMRTLLYGHLHLQLLAPLGAELIWLKFSTVIQQETEIWNEKYQLKSDKTISEKKQGLSWDVLEMQPSLLHNEQQHSNELFFAESEEKHGEYNEERESRRGKPRLLLVEDPEEASSAFTAELTLNRGTESSFQSPQHPRRLEQELSLGITTPREFLAKTLIPAIDIWHLDPKRAQNKGSPACSCAASQLLQVQVCHKGKLKSQPVHVGALGCELWRFSRTPQGGNVNKAGMSPCLLLFKAQKSHPLVHLVRISTGVGHRLLMHGDATEPLCLPAAFVHSRAVRRPFEQPGMWLSEFGGRPLPASSRRALKIVMFKAELSLLCEETDPMGLILAVGATFDKTLDRLKRCHKVSNGSLQILFLQHCCAAVCHVV